MKSDSQDPDFRFLIISIRPWAMGTAWGVLAVGTIVAAHAADAVPAARDGLAVLAVRAAVAVAAALAEHAVHGAGAAFAAEATQILLPGAKLAHQTGKLGVEIGAIHGQELCCDTPQGQCHPDRAGLVTYPSFPISTGLSLIHI